MAVVGGTVNETRGVTSRVGRDNIARFPRRVPLAAQCASLARTRARELIETVDTRAYIVPSGNSKRERRMAAAGRSRLQYCHSRSGSEREELNGRVVY
jgi:hypothetical protein